MIRVPKITTPLDIEAVLKDPKQVRELEIRIAIANAIYRAEKAS
jgi:hypothetical protein